MFPSHATFNTAKNQNSNEPQDRQTREWSTNLLKPLHLRKGFSFPENSHKYNSYKHVRDRPAPRLFTDWDDSSQVIQKVFISYLLCECSMGVRKTRPSEASKLDFEGAWQDLKPL